MRHLIIVVAWFATSSPAICQNNPTDSQTLKAMLEEIRLLRQDLRTTTVAAQRVQIALYRLQLQDAAVARASKLVEEAHSKLNELSAERKRVATDTEQVEDRRNATQDAHERKVMEEEVLPQLKKHLERIARDEEQWQAKSNEAEGQLKAEQVKLDALHN